MIRQDLPSRVGSATASHDGCNGWNFDRRRTPYGAMEFGSSELQK